MTPFVKSNLTPHLNGKKILVGITGSIAAFKACDIIRYLRNCGAITRVVLTEGAENFVTRTTMETLSGNPIVSHFWGDANGGDGGRDDRSTSGRNSGTHHIDTARWADVILVAPATANFIGKMAHGLCDDLLSTEIIAFQGPVLVAPAMNPAMFSHPAVQANVELLKSRNVRILGPTSGVTSCGEEGLGRMIEPDEIVENVAAAFYRPPTGRKCVVTLGPTRSAIDPVRYLTNRSSGMMGASLCWAAVAEGYEVTAVCGPTQMEFPRGVEVVRVQSAQGMADAALKAWTSAHVFISAAAVLDWDVGNYSSEKLKKEVGTPQLQFNKNVDILAKVSQSRQAGQFVLGFAAETDDPIERALKKRRDKGCDAIFVNDVSSSEKGIESEMNGGWWIPATEKVVEIPTSTKPELARKLMKLI